MTSLLANIFSNKKIWNLKNGKYVMAPFSNKLITFISRRNDWFSIIKKFFFFLIKNLRISSVRKYVNPLITESIRGFFPTRKENFSKIGKYFIIFPSFFSEASWWSLFFQSEAYAVLRWEKKCLKNGVVYLFQQKKKSSESQKRIF